MFQLGNASLQGDTFLEQVPATKTYQHKCNAAKDYGPDCTGWWRGTFRVGVSEKGLFVFSEIVFIISFGQITLVVVFFGLILLPAVVLVIIVVKIRFSTFLAGVI